jgi:hypothetical protein
MKYGEIHRMGLFRRGLFRGKYSESHLFRNEWAHYDSGQKTTFTRKIR